MFHHNPEVTYGAAVDEAGRRFKAKLEETIHKSQQSALGVIEKVQAEVPMDRIAHSRALTFKVDEEGEGRQILIGTRDRRASGSFLEPLHRHALNQVADRAGMPETYLGRLLERDYGAQLIVDNLTTIFEKEAPRKYLVRSVGGQVRGVLSDSFRRMDSRPIIEAFAGECQAIGAVPVEGVAGDLRWSLRAILPMVFQPSRRPGAEEFIAFGLALSNSDFGAGALSMRTFMLRVWCTNLAQLEEALRQVHLGKRLADQIEFSRETYRLDTRTQVSAVKDLVKGLLGPAKVAETVALVGKALDERIDPKSAWQALPRLGLLKGEVERVKESFVSGGVEELPAGTTVARLANAIAWVAQTAAVAPERRLDLEQIAGSVLTGGLGRRVADERLAA